MANFFDKGKLAFLKKKSMCFIMKTLRLGLKLKEIRRALELNQSQWQKTYIEFNTHKKKIEVEKIITKMEKRCTN